MFFSFRNFHLDNRQESVKFIMCSYWQKKWWVYIYIFKLIKITKLISDLRNFPRKGKDRFLYRAYIALWYKIYTSYSHHKILNVNTIQTKAVIVKRIAIIVNPSHNYICNETRFIKVGNEVEQHLDITFERTTWIDSSNIPNAIKLRYRERERTKDPHSFTRLSRFFSRTFVTRYFISTCTLGVDDRVSRVPCVSPLASELLWLSSSLSANDDYNYYSDRPIIMSRVQLRSRIT